MVNQSVKYKNLIHKLLDHYIYKSSQSNNPFRYVVYRNSDSDLNLFEKLSSNNQIGIFTNLSGFDSRIILLLLDSLYSKNYYYFQKSFMQDLLYDSDIENEDFGLDNMLNSLENNYIDININKWIEYLELIPSNVEFDDEELEEDPNKLINYVDDFGTEIDQIQIYDKLPEISKYFKLNHKQKFHTLEELYNF